MGKLFLTFIIVFYFGLKVLKIILGNEMAKKGSGKKSFKHSVVKLVFKANEKKGKNYMKVIIYDNPKDTIKNSFSQK